MNISGGNVLIGGNVGIGVDSPSSALHVASPSGDCEISIQSGDLGGHRWTVQSSGSGQGLPVNTFQIIDRTASASRLLIDTSGNVGIGIGFTPPGHLLAVGNAYCDGNNWYPMSDRNAKSGFQPVDVVAILAKVAAMPITSWHYTNDVATPHLGPMAQDFYAAFGVGADDKHISDVDEGGVALAAVQGLNQKMEEQLKSKDAEITELKQRLEKLEQLLVGKNEGAK